MNCLSKGFLITAEVKTTPTNLNQTMTTETQTQQQDNRPLLVRFKRYETNLDYEDLQWN